MRKQGKIYKMTEQQRNELFKAYLIHCLDISTRNMKAETRAAMLENLQTIHKTDDIKEAFNAIRNNI